LHDRADVPVCAVPTPRLATIMCRWRRSGCCTSAARP